ncbi:hypothetical protein AB1N83_011874 [Pleurotus pulmonarius]
MKSGSTNAFDSPVVPFRRSTRGVSYHAHVLATSKRRGLNLQTPWTYTQPSSISIPSDQWSVNFQISVRLSQHGLERRAQVSPISPLSVRVSTNTRLPIHPSFLPCARFSNAFRARTDGKPPNRSYISRPSTKTLRAWRSGVPESLISQRAARLWWFDDSPDTVLRVICMPYSTAPAPLYVCACERSSSRKVVASVFSLSNASVTGSTRAFAVGFRNGHNDAGNCSIQQLYTQVKSRNSRNTENRRHMPKFSTRFPFVKSSKPRTTGATRGNTPAPDNPATGNTTLGNVATQGAVVPRASTSPAVDIAPPTSADPQDNMVAPGNATQGQDVARPIATDVASLLGEPQTPGAPDANTPGRVSPAAGNVAAGNVAMQGGIVPQASTSLPVNIASSAGTEPQANTLAPISVVQRTGDSHVNTVGLARAAVREGSTQEVRPATATQAVPTPEINVEVTETGKEYPKQVDDAPTSAKPLVGNHDPHKDVPKHQITQSKGWKVMRESLRAVKELSDAFMPLKATVSAILLVTDYVEENETKLCNLATEVDRLVKIFNRYQAGGIPHSMYDRLDMTTEKLVSIQNIIEEKRKHGLGKRVITAHQDKSDLVSICEDITELLRFLSLQASFETYFGVDFLVQEERMKSLGHVTSASINAISEDGCLEGTRKDILNGLQKWCQDPSAPPVYWLVGPAGAGKSTIARTFCRSLRTQSLLGGSFFCHRLTAERSDARHVIPTLAWGLPRRNSGYCSALKEIADITTVATSIIKIQIDDLFRQPLMNCNHPEGPEGRHLVFVIDALDECDSASDVRELLLHLLAVAPTLGMKFFVTSRPEPHVRNQLNKREAAREICQLQDVEQSVVSQDISQYIQHQLQNVQQSRDDMPPHWPTQENVKTLTFRAGGLFVYASTALKFIGDESESPVERLQMLIDAPSAAGEAFAGGLNDIYSFILSKAFDLRSRAKDEISRTRQVLELLLAARAPLTLSMIAKLLGTESGMIRTSLNHMHAVIQVPSSGHDDGVVSTYHASFPDFLVRLKVDTHWNNGPTSNVLQELFQNHYLPIGLSSGHHLLAIGCTTIMKAELKFNIVQCPSSFLRNSEQQLQQIEKALLYACLNWPYHIIQAANSGVFLDFVEGFLTTSLLFWLEILSATKNTRSASGMLMRVYDSNLNMSESL